MLLWWCIYFMCELSKNDSKFCMWHSVQNVPCSKWNVIFYGWARGAFISILTANRIWKQQGIKATRQQLSVADEHAIIQYTKFMKDIWPQIKVRFLWLFAFRTLISIIITSNVAVSHSCVINGHWEEWMTSITIRFCLVLIGIESCHWWQPSGLSIPITNIESNQFQPKRLRELIKKLKRRNLEMVNILSINDPNDAPNPGFRSFNSNNLFELS